MVNLISNLTEAIILTLAIINLLFSVKIWRKSKININLFVFLLFLLVFFTSLRQLILSFGLLIDFRIGVSLSLDTIFALVLIVVPAQFLLYLKEWRTLYTLPLNFGFFMGLSFAFSTNEFFFRTIVLVFGGIAFIILIFDAYVSKNGITVSISFVFLYGLSYFPEITELVSFIFRFIAIGVILLGSSGFMDKYVLISKEEDNKVKNTWISRMA